MATAAPFALSAEDAFDQIAMKLAAEIDRWSSNRSRRNKSAVQLKPALSSRRDAPVICARCGKISTRHARQQKYCSAHCRELAKERTRKAFLGQDTGAPPNPPKKINGFKSLPAPKGGSSIALRAPRHVIEAEVFGDRKWQTAVSSDGVVCEVGTLRGRALVNGDAS